MSPRAKAHSSSSEPIVSDRMKAVMFAFSICSAEGDQTGCAMPIGLTARAVDLLQKGRAGRAEARPLQKSLDGFEGPVLDQAHFGPGDGRVDLDIVHRRAHERDPATSILARTGSPTDCVADDDRYAVTVGIERKRKLARFAVGICVLDRVRHRFTRRQQDIAGEALPY